MIIRIVFMIIFPCLFDYLKNKIVFPCLFDYLKNNHD